MVHVLCTLTADSVIQTEISLTIKLLVRVMSLHLTGLTRLVLRLSPDFFGELILILEYIV